MVMFNLLPWREAAKRWQRYLALKLMAFSLLLSVGTVFALHAVLLQGQMNSNQRIAQWQSVLATGSAERVSEEDIAQAHASELTRRLLFALGKPLFNNVCFTEITRDKNGVIFIGSASSALELTRYLREWNAGNLFADVQMEQLKQQDNRSMHFRFMAHP